MRRPARLPQRLLAVTACFSCAGALATAGGAETPSALAQRAEQLRHADASLDAQRRDALLSLYAFDARIVQADARVAVLRADLARVEQQRASTRRLLAAAQTTQRIAQRQLALRLHNLYVRGETDALAVVLGASSLEAALGELETLGRAANVNERIAHDALRARIRLRSLERALARRDERLRRLARAADRTLSVLRAARDERRGLVEDLGRRRRLTDGELDRVQERSRTLAATAVAPAEAPQAVAEVPAPIPSVGRTLTVVATGYSTTGTTASGIAAGPGIAAVDPAVIPLGTRITVPGYGAAVAADTGSAIQGAVIDLWFASADDARAWGRRTVVVTLN